MNFKVINYLCFSIAVEIEHGHKDILEYSSELEMRLGHSKVLEQVCMVCLVKKNVKKGLEY